MRRAGVFETRCCWSRDKTPRNATRHLEARCDTRLALANLVENADNLAMGSCKPRCLGNVLCAFVALVGCLGQQHARAQVFVPSEPANVAVDSATRAKVQQLYAQASRALERGKTRKAAQLASQTFKLIPNASTALVYAVTLERDSRRCEAARNFLKAMSWRHTASEGAQAKEGFARTAAACAPALMAVKTSCSPAGLRLTLGGVPVPCGRLFGVGAGSTSLSAKADGFHSQQFPIAGTAGVVLEVALTLKAVSKPKPVTTPATERAAAERLVASGDVQAGIQGYRVLYARTKEALYLRRAVALLDGSGRTAEARELISVGLRDGVLSKSEGDTMSSSLTPTPLPEPEAESWNWIAIEGSGAWMSSGLVMGTASVSSHAPCVSLTLAGGHTWHMPSGLLAGLSVATTFTHFCESGPGTYNTFVGGVEGHIGYRLFATSDTAVDLRAEVGFRGGAFWVDGASVALGADRFVLEGTIAPMFDLRGAIWLQLEFKQLGFFLGLGTNLSVMFGGDRPVGAQLIELGSPVWLPFAGRFGVRF